MDFRFLGVLEVDAGEGPLALGGPKQRAVLAHLLLRSNSVVPADVLVDALWGEEPPETARGTLQAYVSRLRSILGDERLDGRSAGYVLHVAPDEADGPRFEALLAEGRSDLADAPAVAASTFAEALALWRGPAFADLASEPSLGGEIARYEELRLACIEERITARLAAGDHRALVGELEELVHAHPLRERLWGDLMVALYRSGRQADALEAFARARTRLREDLGIDPSRRLRRLHEQILAQDPSLSAPSRPLARPVASSPSSVLTGDLPADTTIGGYRIEDVLGRGGMSVVYLAEDLRLHRRVALKVLSPALSERPGFRDRFVRESQVAAAIEHPAIVPIYEAGEDGGLLYIAMRYVRGTDLRRLLAEHGPLDADRAIAIVRRVAEALDAAHTEGLVHRDVKPANILLVEGAGGDGDDLVYLSDFGLTKRLEGDAGGLTETGRFVGTVDYVAPEQIEGAALDGRADVYSLACVLFECLTGLAPHHRDTEAATLYAHLSGDAPSLLDRRPELSGELDDAVRRGMSLRPNGRFERCGDLANAARATIEPATLASPPRPGRTGRAAAAAIVGALVAISVVVALAIDGGAPPRARTGPSPTPSVSPVFAMLSRPPTEVERRLLGLVPSSLRGTCRPAAIGSTPSSTDAALAAVACASGATDVRFELFGDAPSMNAAFGNRANATDAFGGDCATDHVAQNDYSVGGADAGRVICDQTEERSAIAWTDARVLVMGEAVRQDAGDLALYRWWLGAGPVLDGTAATKDDDSPPAPTFPTRVYATTVTDAKTQSLLGSFTDEPLSVAMRLVAGTYHLVFSGGSAAETGTYVLAKGGELVLTDPAVDCHGPSSQDAASYSWSNRPDGSIVWTALDGISCQPGPTPIVGPRHPWTPIPPTAVVFDEHGEVVLSDFETLAAEALTRVEPEGVAIEPTWSPDGERIAYVSHPGDADSFDVYTMNGDGSDQTRVAELEGDEFDPAWSPDGTRIAFRSATSEERSVIEVIDVASPTGEPRVVFDRPGVQASNPAWSTDGSRIAFAADGDILVVDADGTDVTRIAVSHAEGGRTAPTWTPDGADLVYWGSLGGRGELLSVRPDGGPPRPFGWAGLEANAMSVSWSPDGRWIGLGAVRGAPGEPITPGDLGRAPDAASFPTKAYIAPADGSRFFIVSTLGTAPQWRPETTA